MFRKEIDVLFTNKMVEYINKGYSIHSNTMGGSQGEQAKVDLSKDNDVIRILLHTKYSGLSCTKLVITIGRNTNKLHNTSTDIIWNNDLEILEEIEFIKLSENYYVTPEEYPSIREKQKNRLHHKTNYSCKNFSDEAKKIVLSFIQRQPKCKSIKLKDIERVYRVVDKHYINDTIFSQYIVEAKGNRYKLE